MTNNEKNPGKLPSEDIDPSTGRPWGVRAMRGGPILAAPVDERKPDGYATAAFKTPAGTSGPYQPRKIDRAAAPEGAFIPPSNSADANAPVMRPGDAAPVVVPSAIARGEHSGGEWGPPLTSDQANPAYARPASGNAPVVTPFASAAPSVTASGTAPVVTPLNGASNGSLRAASGTAPVVTPLNGASNGRNGQYVPEPRRKVPQLCDFDRVRAMLDRYNLDGVLCALPHNVHYLSGHEKPPLWEFQWHTFAIVPRHGPPALILSQLDLSVVAETELYVDEFFPYSYSDIIRWDAMSLLETEQIVKALNDEYRDKRSATKFEATAKAIRALGLEGKRVGIDDVRILHRIGVDVQAFDAEDAMREVRMIKNPAEVEKMRAVAVANEAAALAAAYAIPESRTWDDVVQRFGAELALLGGRARYFLGGAPHHTGTHQHSFYDYPLQRGDFYMVDALGEKGHYIGDFGRTVSWGEPNPKALQRFNAMRKGFDAGMAMVRPGVAFEDVRKKVVDTIHGEGFGEYSLCVPHSVGMEHTDSPKVPGLIIQENMTMNIDIAYLEAGFGSLHLEDTFWVRSNGPELLTSGNTAMVVLP